MRFVALRYFLETARLGSIRRAAEVLHVAPSALSRQIVLLEEDFGASLFERAGGMRLTEAGELFAEQARATLADFARLRSNLDDVQHLRRGTVRIGCVDGAVAWLLFPAFKVFGERYPGIAFDVHIGGIEMQFDGLVRHDLDLMVLLDPPPHPDMQIEREFENPMVAIVSPDHPLAKRESLRLADLADQRLALASEARAVRILLDRAAALENVTLSAALTLDSAGHTIAFARQGLGVAFASHRLVRDEVAAGWLVPIPIRSPVLEHLRVVLCRHRTHPLPRAAQAFLDALKDQLRGIS